MLEKSGGITGQTTKSTLGLKDRTQKKMYIYVYISTNIYGFFKPNVKNVFFKLFAPSLKVIAVSSREHVSPTRVMCVSNLTFGFE